MPDVATGAPTSPGRAWTSDGRDAGTGVSSGLATLPRCAEGRRHLTATWSPTLPSGAAVARGRSWRHAA